MTETTEHFDRVHRFMQLAGQATPTAPAEMDSATRELRARLLLEEAFETIIRGLGVSVYLQGSDEPIGSNLLRVSADDDAYDPVELLDGCCDVHVITTGTLIAAGLTDAGPQILVDENNLAKFGSGGQRRADGKWVKPADHQPPDLAGEIRRQAGGKAFR